MHEERASVLRSMGACDACLDELLAYTESPYRDPRVPVDAECLPLADEPHLEAWRRYHLEAQSSGVEAVLRHRLVQFRFPIRAGMSEDPVYRAATLRGDLTGLTDSLDELELVRPEGLVLELHATMGGQIPVLITDDRRDFVAIVRALGMRNEPRPIPGSMGACIIKGLNNWARIREYRSEWEKKSTEVSEADWMAEFARLVPRKELYQDRLVILSQGPYSAVSGRDIGVDEDEWLARSLVLRREHEFTHFFLERVFGVMRNNVLDELIADFIGMIRACGYYDADLARRFLGLTASAEGAKARRLDVYRGDPPLSDVAFSVVHELGSCATRNLEQLWSSRDLEHPDLRSLASATLSLAGLSLEALAVERLQRFVSL